jgi:hypothetical protein
MEKPKDKRTKAYKEWVEKYENAPNGAGDIVETITKKTGIKSIVNKITKDCGCDERKAALNKILPLKPSNCFTEEQFEQWTIFRERPNQNTVTKEEQKLISDVLRHIYGIAIKQSCQSCSGGVYKKWIDKINKFYDSY